MKEIWKDIENFEGIYQVSNLGKVRSLDRKVHNYIKKGRILKERNNGHGYMDVGLSTPNKKEKHAYIHILVAKSFIPKSEGKEFVNHKDFDKSNNCVDNLEWVTREENLLHYRQSLRYNKDLRELTDKHHAKFDRRVFKYKDEIVKLYDKGYTSVEIGHLLNVGRDFTIRVLRMHGRA